MIALPVHILRNAFSGMLAPDPYQHMIHREKVHWGSGKAAKGNFPSTQAN